MTDRKFPRSYQISGKRSVCSSSVQSWCVWKTRLSRKGALQIPPLRYASVGMTRGEQLLFGRVATWMDGVSNS
jgi:hypothetical protein